MGGLTHASPAGTPTQVYEDELLRGYGAEAKPEVFIVTSRTMVAINHHRLTVLREPSQQVSPGLAVPQTPKMYAAFELQPFQWIDGEDGATYDLYKLPESLTEGSLVTAALLPVEFKGLAMTPEQSMDYADILLGSKCSFFGGRRLAGNCTIISPGNGASGEDTGVVLPSNFGWLAGSGVVVGGVAVPKASRIVYADKSTSNRRGDSSESYAYGYSYDYAYAYGMDDVDASEGGGPPLSGVFASATRGRPPYFAMTMEFNQFAWMSGDTGKASSVRAGGAFERAGTLQQPATFRKMQVSTEAARIDLLNTVPKDITVGDSFMLEAKVFISSGMHLGGSRVCASAVSALGLQVSPSALLIPATTRTTTLTLMPTPTPTPNPSPSPSPPGPNPTQVSPAAFLMDAFNIELPTLGADSARLSEQSNCGITDDNGVARLILEFVAGTDGEQVAIQVEGGGVTSERSTTATLRTLLRGVGANNQSIDLTGLKGVGKKSIVEQRMKNAADELVEVTYESFPIVVPLDNLTIPLDFDLQFGPIKLGAFCQSNFYLRIFTKEGIELIRERDRLLANVTATLTEYAGEVGDTLGEVDEVGEVGEAVSASAARGNEVYTSIKEAIKTSGAEMLPSFITLLTSGSMPQLMGDSKALAEIPKSFTVSIYNGVETTDAAGKKTTTSGLTISDLEMTIHKPAEYYIQPVSGGIAGPLIGPFKVEAYNGQTAAAIALDMGLKIFTLIVVGLAAVGNSDWHNPLYAVPIGLASSGLVMALAAAYYPVKSANSIGLWYIVTLTIMFVGTLWGGLSALLGAKLKFMRSFTAVRRERMFAYCRAFVKKPPSEAAQIMAEIRADVEVDLATRLYLERRLQMEIEKERLWRTQLREIGQQFVNGDSAAFFYPTRMYATLIVSVFAMGFWAQGIVNYFNGLAANVRSAHATANPTRPEVHLAPVAGLRRVCASRTCRAAPCAPCRYCTRCAWQTRRSSPASVRCSPIYRASTSTSPSTTCPRR